MIVPWNDEDSASWTDEIDQLKYASQLMRQNAKWIGPLFQISTKTQHINIYSQSEEVLHFVDDNQNPSITSPPQYKTEIKITDLSIEPLQRITNLETISTEQLILSLAKARLNPLEVVPSGMALLHAVIPHQVILFCQPASVLGLACTVEGIALLAREAKEPFSIIPLMIPGLELARECLLSLNINHSSSHPSDIRILVLNGQGVIVFGENLRLAYNRLSEFVETALKIVGLNKYPEISKPFFEIIGAEKKTRLFELAALRKAVSMSARHPLIMHCAEIDLGEIPDPINNETSGLAIQSFARATCQTRAKVMIGLDIDKYIDDYAQLAHQFIPGNAVAQNFFPRIILNHPSRVCSLGLTSSEALLAQELFMLDQNITMIATYTGAHQALSILDLIKYEAFCHKEKSVLHRYQTGNKLESVFKGEIALVTGGASGIGKACVQALLEHGAAVISLDINPAVTTQFDTPEYLGLVCDLTNELEVITAFEQAMLAFGGMDMLVLNAGVFPAGCRIESLTLTEWQRVMRINLDSNLIVLREAHALLKHSPNGGRVLVNASKNVLAPGAGAAAYSSSKAAVTQMARVAALEWGKDHIRVNMIHPDAIFDTGIWTEEVIQARAAHYGMTVQQYKTRNILGVELNSRYVAELVVEMLGPRFEKITGAQIPVDGGSDRVI